MKNTALDDYATKPEKHTSYYIEPKSLPSNDYAELQGASKDNKPEKASFESAIPAPRENTKQDKNGYENESLLKKENAGPSEPGGKKNGKLQKSYALEGIHPNHLLDSSAPPRYDAVMMEEYV